MSTYPRPQKILPQGVEPQFQMLDTDKRTRGAVGDIVIYVVLQLGFGFSAFGIAMAAGLVPATMDPAQLEMSSFLVATLIGLCLASATMLYLRRKTLQKAWHYRPAKHLKYPKLSSMGIMIAALALGSLYTYLIDRPLQPEYQVLGQMVRDGGLPALVVILAVVILGPAVEELLFRVQLQAAVAKKAEAKMGEQKAIALGMVVSTIAFAFIHFQLTAAPAQLLMGGALAIIYQRHRSFSEVWLLHSAVNLIGILTINM